MGKTTLVDTRIAEAHKLVDYLISEAALEVTAAYWKVDVEGEGRWKLHMISPTVSTIGLRDGLTQLLLTMERHDDIQIDSNEIWIESPDRPVVVEILDLLHRYPASEAFRLN